ncbi:hypothetical protein VTL71DRAFT_8681 [Oculimacula yallundae]|uniref:Uncharacterized protein n=1 Tax=Oculimacula yallundae TaxID=86028 RepID=A0ABR4CZG2_9HELO
MEQPVKSNIEPKAQVEAEAEVEVPVGYCHGCKKDIRNLWGTAMLYRYCVVCAKFCNLACKVQHFQQPPHNLDAEAAAKAAGNHHAECTCGRDFLLDIELVNPAQVNALGTFPRISRTVNVSGYTTFKELHNIIRAVYPAEYSDSFMFLDPHWANCVAATTPEDSKPVRNWLKGGPAHIAQLLIADKIPLVEKTPRHFTHTSAVTRRGIHVWLGEYEQRTHFWYMGGNPPQAYNCFLITLLARVVHRHMPPWVTRVFGGISDDAEPIKFAWTCQGGSWKALYQYFSQLTTSQFLLRSYMPGTEASPEGLEAIRDEVHHRFEDVIHQVQGFPPTATKLDSPPPDMESSQNASAPLKPQAPTRGTKRDSDGVEKSS